MAELERRSEFDRAVAPIDQMVEQRRAEWRVELHARHGEAVGKDTGGKLRNGYVAAVMRE
jgi:hypothetical protein